MSFAQSPIIVAVNWFIVCTKRKTIVAGVFRLFFGLKLNPYRVSSYMRQFRLPHITFKPSFNFKETAVMYRIRIQANLHTISCRSLLVHHKVKSKGFIKTKVFTQFPYFRKNRKETLAKLLYTKLLLVTIIYAEFHLPLLPLRSCVYICIQDLQSPAQFQNIEQARDIRLADTCHKICMRILMGVATIHR